MISGTSLKLNSNFQPKKCTSEDDDRISELPDDILLHILSFLTVKEVVVTSLISRRWSHLWRYTPILIFRDELKHIYVPKIIPDHPSHSAIGSLKNIEWVNSVLNSHRAVSLNKFSLIIYLHELHPLSKWLHFVLSRRVKSLELNFCCSPCAIHSSVIFNSGIQSCFLKELKLKIVDASGEAIESFLRVCPLLERLFIKYVHLISDFVIDGPALKHLKLIVSGHHFPVSIKVSAPNLTRFDCQYSLKHLYLENVPNLVESSIAFTGHLQNLHQLAKEAAKFEVLTIILSLPPTTAFLVPQMPKLKKLVLKCLDMDRNNLASLRVTVTCVLQASPCLREFRLEINGRDDRKRIFGFPEFGFSHNCLQVFEFSGFCGSAADHMKLLRYIVVNCVALREINITTATPENLPESKDYLEYDFHVVRSEMGVVSLKMRKRHILT